MKPAQFTQRVAIAFKRVNPGLVVEISKDLELKLVPPDGKHSSAFLDNLYVGYCQRPECKELLIRAYVQSLADSPAYDDNVLLKDVVAVVRDHTFIPGIRATLKERGQPDIDFVSEPLTEGLDIVYAVDSANSFRYLTPKDLETLRLDGQTLLSIAIENLNRVLPDIEMANQSGIAVISAGGVYESSILLVEKFWNRARLGITGEIVIGVPARGTLFITDSTNAKNVGILRQLCAKLAASGQYPMTPQLFCRTETGFRPFN